MWVSGMLFMIYLRSFGMKLLIWIGVVFRGFCRWQQCSCICNGVIGVGLLFFLVKFWVVLNVWGFQILVWILCFCVVLCNSGLRCFSRIGILSYVLFLFLRLCVEVLVVLMDLGRWCGSESNVLFLGVFFSFVFFYCFLVFGVVLGLVNI